MTAADALAAAMAEAIGPQHWWLSTHGAELIAVQAIAALTPDLLWDYLIERGWAAEQTSVGVMTALKQGPLYRRVEAP